MGLITKSLANQIFQAPQNNPVGTERIPLAVDPTVPYVDQIEYLTLDQIVAFVQEELIINGSTYLPVASALVNLDAAVPATARFHRIGAAVFVSGLIALDPTAGLAAECRLTVPIVSAFGAAADASGDFSDAIADHGRITAVAGTALVLFEFTAVSVVSTTYGYNFSYSIIPA